MEKRIINRFGTHYLLGINHTGDYVWLEKESWDCDWYWGFGYLHIYTNNANPERAKDISEHFHFDSAFLNGPETSGDIFKKYFRETVLTEDEMWILCDLMTTFYTLKKTAALFNRGYSYQTKKAKLDKLQSPMTEDLINKILLPEVFKKIEQLLTPLNS